MPNQAELEAIYKNRFRDQIEYRKRVWATLCSSFWSRLIPEQASVLDLGSGYGEFINQIHCAHKWAMDLNPSSPRYLDSSVVFLQQDCSDPWQIPDESLDVIFSSNFFEHLPTKVALSRTFSEARRCLRNDGLLIAMGPNIRYLPGEYWDFWDHYLPLTDKSLAEGLRAGGFDIDKQIPRFLPYTMSQTPSLPSWLIALYLHTPLLWPLFGRQFLVIARKPGGSA